MYLATTLFLVDARLTTCSPSVCIASIMRLVAVVTEATNDDMTWNLINQATWATVEADVAIISGTSNMGSGSNIVADSSAY